MRRGPKPKPSHLRRLEGNPSRRPINDAEPTCDLPPEMPLVVRLNPIAAAEWERVLAAMPRGLYSALDVSVLTQYALAWSLLVQSQRDIEANGLTTRTARGTGTNPAVLTWRGASDTLMKCADRLGLHPGARTRLSVPERGQTPETSNFSGLLGPLKSH